MTYGDLVTLQKDDSGGIAAITAQAAAMGRLQTEFGRQPFSPLCRGCAPPA